MIPKIIKALIIGTLFTACLSNNSEPAVQETRPIVVLGSSTAAGTGASDYAHSWVGLLEKHLKGLQPSTRIINLAKGGLTTFHILQTGSTRTLSWVAPDTQSNITKALSMNPLGIIINMPSNDTYSGISLGDQLLNYHILDSISKAAGVRLWICTPQPRSNLSASGKSVQVQLKDSLTRLYGTRVIDFWTDLATPDGFIAHDFDAGDSVHLNNAGHALLYNRVLQAHVLDSISAL